MRFDEIIHYFELQCKRYRGTIRTNGRTGTMEEDIGAAYLQIQGNSFIILKYQEIDVSRPFGFPDDSRRPRRILISTK